MQKIIPNLWFDSQAEEAVSFYVSLFGNSRISNITRYGKAGAEVAGRPQGSVLTVDFQLEGQRFVALNGGPVFSFTPAISFMAGCSSAQEVDRLFAALSAGGEILMPRDKYPFSDRYAWINDRFALSWQLYLGPTRQKITPCLMFVRQNYGKAVEAARFYVSVFDNSELSIVVPYERAEGVQEGAVKHAAFSLDGVQFMAMDSGLEHKFSFSPAISFMVACGDQQEIDHFWKSLSAVPEAEQCGWLQDRYGVSWQIVPAELDTMMRDADPERSERVMQAVLTVKKLDIADIRRAYEQREG